MKKGIVRDTVLLFALSIISKLVALLKTVIQASFYGSNLQTDAFNMANGIVSNLLDMLTTSLAVAFVPLYIQKKMKDNEEAAKIFATKTITFFSLISLVVIIILEVTAPSIMKMVAPAYDGEILADSILFFRVMIGGFLFAVISSIYQNLLNSERVYGAANISSVVNSLVMIAVVLLLAKRWKVWALVISIPLSYFFQFIVTYVRGRKYGRLSLKYGLRDESLWMIMVQAVPILISQATVEINQVIDRALLTGVGEGAVTSVTYSGILYQFASGIIILPLSTVMFTELSEAGASNDREKMQLILRKVFKIIVLICLPITIITLFASHDIVDIVYGYGNFDEVAVWQTAEGLFGYIICLIPGTLKSILLKAYYALNDTRRPMVMGMFEVVTNIGLSVLLVKSYGILGVVGATAIASFLFILVILIDYKRVYSFKVHFFNFKDYWKIVLAGVTSFILLYIIREITFSSSLVAFFVKALVCGMSFFSVLFLTGEAVLVHGLRAAFDIFQKSISKFKR